MRLTRRQLVAALALAPLARPLRAQSAGTRPASQFALDLCGRICKAVGLSQNFIVLAGDIEAAEARLVGNSRQIVYSEDWLRRSEIGSGSGVPSLVVLAHEIGHHLNGHTLDALPADVVTPGGPRFRLREELEADLFAGGITARLAYPVEAGLPAFAATGETATLDHPSRRERENHYRAGWEAAPRPGACTPPAARDAPVEIVNIYTHSESAARIQSQFRGESGAWTELQNGAPFAAFEEVYRDSCRRVLLFDPDRGLWVRLTPSATGFGRGEFAQGVATRVPVSWSTLDFAATGGPQSCSRGRLSPA